MVLTVLILIEKTKRFSLIQLIMFPTNTFDNIDSATRARDNLNGADIYSGCCTLKIDYAKVSENSFYFFKLLNNYSNWQLKIFWPPVRWWW